MRGTAAASYERPSLLKLSCAAASPFIWIYLSVALSSFDVFRLAWSRGGFVGWVIQVGSSTAFCILRNHSNVHR